MGVCGAESSLSAGLGENVYSGVQGTCKSETVWVGGVLGKKKLDGPPSGLSCILCTVVDINTGETVSAFCFWESYWDDRGI